MKRYHHFLHCIYEILIKELENDNLIKVIILQIIVKTINNIIKSNKLISILLIYRIYSKSNNINLLTVIIIQYIKTIKKTIIKIYYIYIKK